jgi:predicted enzyme related to lactoylglutathione lyase
MILKDQKRFYNELFGWNFEKLLEANKALTVSVIKRLMPE